MIYVYHYLLSGFRAGNKHAYLTAKVCTWAKESGLLALCATLTP